MIYSGVYACLVRSEMFRVSGVGTLQACMRRQVNGQSVRHITCPKQQMKQSLLIHATILYTQSIYSSRLWQSAIYARRAVVAERECGLSLMPRDGKGCRDLLQLARTRRRDVTRGDGVGRLVGGSRRAERGAWIDLCDYAGRCRGARLLKVWILSAVNSGGRAENARALCKE